MELGLAVNVKQDLGLNVNVKLELGVDVNIKLEHISLHFHFKGYLSRDWAWLTTAWFESRFGFNLN